MNMVGYLIGCLAVNFDTGRPKPGDLRIGALPSIGIVESGHATARDLDGPGHMRATVSLHVSRRVYARDDDSQMIFRVEVT